MVVVGLADAPAPAGSHLLPSVRGELLARLGRPDEARTESGRAVARCGTSASALLEGEVAAVG